MGQQESLSVSGNPDPSELGQKSLELAHALAAKGLHSQAAWRYNDAAEQYELAEKFAAAGQCRVLAERERRLVRPSAPVNVSALVD